MRDVKVLSVNPGVKFYASVICAVFSVVFFGTKVLADERYKETQAYQEYLLLPDSYKSPEMEAKFKHGYDAENAVKNFPCASGGTVSECLDTMATNQGYEDLGWSTSGDFGSLIVERVFVTWNGKAMTYRWSVDASGNVKAQSKEARKLLIK